MTRPVAKPRNVPSPCNVLLVGNGGREHALGWKLRQSPRLGQLWLHDAGNFGLDRLGRPCPLKFDEKAPFRMQRWCEEEEIGLVVVGPDAYVAAGMADALTSDRTKVFAPTREAARIEWDKAYAKQLMRTASIPTAEARVFTEAAAAKEYLLTRQDGVVVKAAGLAAGKGVIVCETPSQAIEAVDRIMVRREFGAAGDVVILEERLTGKEVSVLALVDGRTIWVLDPCQDHKRVGEGDVGPNTGGMGAYCPTPVIDAATLDIVQRDVLVPIVDALRRDGIIFRGCLYAGLMLTAGGPKVLEFNARFGDPETQPLMARLKGDLVEILWSTAAGALDRVQMEFDSRTACCVVVCSGGYPGAVTKGNVIEGLEELHAMADADAGEEIVVFHAGTARDREGRVVTAGGRVVGVTALAKDLRTARDLANRACERVNFAGAFFRRDIGERVLSPTVRVRDRAGSASGVLGAARPGS
jgi:phosphoribosylamine---glycine ligase